MARSGIVFLYMSEYTINIRREEGRKGGREEERERERERETTNNVHISSKSNGFCKLL